MSWGDNLLTNPSAETQDVSGWTSSGITVEEKTTVASGEDVYVKGLNVTNEKPLVYFATEGMTGEYAFLFASDEDAYMYQTIDASGMDGQPENLQFTCRYKLKVQQDPWDSDVLGTARLRIVYEDGTSDYYIIPLVLGVKASTRYFTDFWILVQNTCEVNSDKTLDYVEVRAEADNCENNLVIDYFELREEV